MQLTVSKGSEEPLPWDMLPRSLIDTLSALSPRNTWIGNTSSFHNINFTTRL